MTDDRARKKAVRRRMEQTGEKYTEARRALENAARDPETEPAHVQDATRRGQFGRFTEGARRVVVLAREEARTLKHHFVGSEHMLLGLIRETESTAHAVLLDLDADPGNVRNEILKRLPKAG